VVVLLPGLGGGGGGRPQTRDRSGCVPPVRENKLLMTTVTWEGFNAILKERAIKGEKDKLLEPIVKEMEFKKK